MPPRRQQAASKVVPVVTVGVQPQAAKPPPDGKPSVVFDHGLFGRWLRMLLVAFYTDEEAVVADVLYRRAALLRDTAIARFLGLPDRQVRQALERRLVPDGLAERLTEGVAPHTHTFYRICPAAIAVVAQRLQTLEDRLGAVTEDEYYCPKCRRTYDSLQAVSLTKHHRAKDGGSGAFAFLCEDCSEELMVAAETAKVQHDRLQRFRTQCRDLLLLTREIKDMPIPHFKREVQERRKEPQAPAATSGAAAAAATAAPGAAGPSTAVGSTAGASAGAAPSSAEEDKRARDYNAWFHREVLGTEPKSCSAASARPAAAQGEDLDAALQGVVAEAQSQLKEERLQRFSQDLAGRAQDVRRRAAEGAKADEPTVTVQGQPYTLARARDDEDLQEAMTDEEYQRFVDLDRQVHGVALCHGF